MPVDIASASALSYAGANAHTAGTNLSIRAWVYFDGILNPQYFVHFEPSAGAFGLALQILLVTSSPRIGIAVSMSGTGLTRTSDTIIQSKRWYCIHAKLETGYATDATKVTIYINGVKETSYVSGSINGTGTQTALSGTLRIGGRSSDATRDFDGRIHDVVTWNTLLSDSDVASDYADSASSVKTSGITFRSRLETTKTATGIGGGGTLTEVGTVTLSNILLFAGTSLAYGIASIHETAHGLTEAGDGVSAWSDLTLNGNDASQATVNLRPHSVVSASGRTVVVFSEDDGTADYMTLASETRWHSNRFTFCLMGGFSSFNAASPSSSNVWVPGSSFAAYADSGGGGFMRLWDGVARAPTADMQWSSVRGMNLISGGASGTVFRRNNLRSTGPAATAREYLGGTFGSSANPCLFDVDGIFIWQRQISQIEEDLLLLIAVDAGYIPKVPTSLAVFEGSSTMNNSFATLGQGTAWLLFENSALNDYEGINVSKGGDKLSNVSSDAASHIDAAFAAKAWENAVLFIEIGSNDLYIATVTDAETLTFDLEEFLADRIFATPGLRTVVGTILPRETAGTASNTQRELFNAGLIAGDIPSAHGVARMSENVALQDGAQGGVYYANDIHPNDDGFRLIAPYWLDAFGRAISDNPSSAAGSLFPRSGGVDPRGIRRRGR